MAQKKISDSEQTLINDYFAKQKSALEELIATQKYDEAIEKLNTFLEMDLLPLEYADHFSAKLKELEAIQADLLSQETANWKREDYFEHIVVHNQIHTHYVCEYLDKFIADWSINDEIYFNNLFLSTEINVLEKVNLLAVLSEYQISVSLNFYNQYLNLHAKVIPADYFHLSTQSVELFDPKIPAFFAEYFEEAFKQDPFKYDYAMKMVDIYCRFYFLNLESLNLKRIAFCIVQYMNLVYEDIALDLSDDDLSVLREITYLFHIHNN
ncbi:DUF3196 family protein [Ureaplasma miroungigenitalium]|uniref:DUF3196 family protein n=1 Tax=Ureaplasma miroungigenitalium TaxID=1042321 RepID=A0ABT3BMG1_9BACT|nr:DUF3196 family protein [Ureaplasma miroungigenitalium]MCV3728217.1 DUF3196 family protein [Ureaplasma miroungigenitalium]MCV3734021.1 DUF3196 family protein [Ureaplasma miroungigenitalium]